jgi:purine catabolism regulator
LDRAFGLLGGDPTGTDRALPLHLALRLRDRQPRAAAEQRTALATAIRDDRDAS